NIYRCVVWDNGCGWVLHTVPTNNRNYADGYVKQNTNRSKHAPPECSEFPHTLLTVYVMR
ncbi:MAG: hypothetical protein QW303_00420, partial [Nitrososphaerota archaeon]